MKAYFNSQVLLASLLILCQSLSWAQTSAVRKPAEHWLGALKRNSVFVDTNTFLSGRPSALGAARFYSFALDVRALPEWNGTDQELQGTFEEMRDERLYVHSSQPPLVHSTTSNLGNQSGERLLEVSWRRLLNQPAIFTLSACSGS